MPAAQVDDMCMAEAEIQEIQEVTCQDTTEASGSPSEVSTDLISLAALSPALQLGLKLKRDPYGRDAPRKNTKSEWSPEPLAKYLKGVASQIDANIQNHRLPTAEKLDTFVNRLVLHTHRQLRHAPKKVRHTLNALCARRFQRFWNFSRNEKVRTTTPEELTSTLLGLVEAILSEFATYCSSSADKSHDAAQWLRSKQWPQSSGHYSGSQWGSGASLCLKWM